MSKHDVLFNVPERSLGKTDIDFVVKKNGTVFGKLAVSKGAVVWFPKGSRNGCKMRWKTFDKMMRDNAVKSEHRKR